MTLCTCNRPYKPPPGGRDNTTEILICNLLIPTQIPGPQCWPTDWICPITRVVTVLWLPIAIQSASGTFLTIRRGGADGAGLWFHDHRNYHCRTVPAKFNQDSGGVRARRNFPPGATAPRSQRSGPDIRIRSARPYGAHFVATGGSGS